jgi:site-specific DNA recombinase
LITILAKAHDWLTRLTSGCAASVLAIAKQEKVGSSYVTRLLYLGCLAPDIVERVLRGQHPPELNADRLIRVVPLPLDWKEQRQLLGMTS